MNRAARTLARPVLRPLMAAHVNVRAAGVSGSFGSGMSPQTRRHTALVAAAITMPKTVPRIACDTVREDLCVLLTPS